MYKPSTSDQLAKVIQDQSVTKSDLKNRLQHEVEHLKQLSEYFILNDKDNHTVEEIMQLALDSLKNGWHAADYQKDRS